MERIITIDDVDGFNDASVIQAALNASVRDDIVTVGPGTFNMYGDTSYFNSEGVTFRGSGSTLTKLQWNQGIDYIANNGNNNIILSDMWVSGSNITNQDLDGIYFKNGNNMTIENVKLTDSSKHGIRATSVTDFKIYNSAVIGGINSNSGVFVDLCENGEIVNNIVTKGSAFGIEINRQNGGMLVANNVVSGFGIAGQYMYSKGNGNVITNNTYYGNKNGIRFLSGTEWIVINNIIRNNVENGIYLEERTYMGNATFTNNLIYGNGGSGIKSNKNTPATRWNPTIIIKNNVIASNNGNGISMNLVDVTFDVSNNIIYDNNGTAMVQYDGVFNSKYNDLYGNSKTYSGIIAKSNDIYSDPLFYNPSDHDYHLKSMFGRWNGYNWIIDNVTSPCIDAGDPTSDYSLEPLPNGERINMGAYGNTIEASLSESGYKIPTVTNMIFSPEVITDDIQWSTIVTIENINNYNVENVQVAFYHSETPEDLFYVLDNVVIPALSSTVVEVLFDPLSVGQYNICAKIIGE